jgi:hypothetical protein
MESPTSWQPGPQWPTSDVVTGPGRRAAETFSEARVTGFDFHEPSIDSPAPRRGSGRRRPRDVHGGRAKGYEARTTSFGFFDCIHDMGDQSGSLATPVSTSPRTAPCSLSSRSFSTTVPPTSRTTPWLRCCTRLPRHLRPIRCRRRWARSRRPGRRARLETFSRRPDSRASGEPRRDAAEPHPRGKDLESCRAGGRCHRPRSMSRACSGSPHRM